MGKSIMKWAAIALAAAFFCVCVVAVEQGINPFTLIWDQLR
jgi:hypothetical protein